MDALYPLLNPHYPLPRLRLSLVIPWLLKSSHGIQRSKFLQPFIYKSPGAIFVLIYLAFSFISSTARAIYKTLVT